MPSTRTSIGLRRALQQALRGQHVLHFAGADAERQRAERAVRGGVAVAADHRHAGLREALLRSDDVHDALLARCAGRKQRMPNSRQFFSSWSSCVGGDLVDDRQRAVVVGMLWSVVAMVRSGRRTLRPRSRKP